MVEMICKIAGNYEGRMVKVGERFSVEPRFVVPLMRLGRAVTVEHYEDFPTRDMSAAPAQGYMTREMQTQPTIKRGRGRPRKVQQ